MSTEQAYVAYTSCGCAVVVMVDDPLYRTGTAREVARCIRNGLTIERRTIAEVRTLALGCVHRKVRAQQGSMQL